MCAGQVKEAVFRDAFAATAVTPDQQLLVDVPALKKTPGLDREIGIHDVGKFTQLLGALTGEGNTGVEVELDLGKTQLVIDEDARGSHGIPTTDPKVIATYIADDDATKMFGVKLTDETTIPLDRVAIDGARKLFGILKPEVVSIVVAEGVASIVIGAKKEYHSTIPLGEVDTDAEYTLLFGKHLVDVFSTITDYSNATLRLGGPGKLVLISDGGYRYLLAPRKETEDEAVAERKTNKEARAASKAKKGKKATKPEPEPDPDDDEE